jgi:tetratricopeptide (TPR) repeat protein
MPNDLKPSMSIFKVILNIIFLALVVSGSAFAADQPAVRSDLEKLQEQIHTIDKDLSIYKEVSAAKLDSQDKRLGDIALNTAQQANHLAAISNQTTTVGNYIAITSALITILVLIAGFITYFSAVSKAEKEARNASALWFKQNAADLQKEFEKLRAEAQKVSAQIESHGKQIASEASSTSAAMAKAGRAVLVLGSARGSANETPREAPNQQAVQTVREASEALKDKPESQFTAADYYARGLASFSSKNYQSALSVFEQAIALSKADTPTAQISQYLFAKGVTLGALGKSEEEIAVYDEIDRRFGKDESPSVREQVALAVNGLGFAKFLLAKVRWPEEAERHALLAASTPALERALILCAQDKRAMVLGNLGYSLFLAGQHHAARAPTLECLQLGGQEQLDVQRADAEKHRVEPEDTHYCQLLDELWRSL